MSRCIVEQFFRSTPQLRRKQLMNKLFEVRANALGSETYDLVALIETIDGVYHKVKEEEEQRDQARTNQKPT